MTTIDKARSMEIAETIRQQLGGRMFSLCTGAKDFVAMESGLSFKIGRNPKSITHVRITLTTSDDYYVEFMRWNGRKAEMTKKATFDGVYADMLKDIFYEGTGLYASLR